MINTWLQKLAALVCVGLMAYAVDPTGTHWWLIFSFLAIVLVLEFIAYRNGVLVGIQYYKNASPEERRDIDRILEEGK
jgi:hypothetical protein